MKNTPLEISIVNNFFWKSLNILFFIGIKAVIKTKAIKEALFMKSLSMILICLTSFTNIYAQKSPLRILYDYENDSIHPKKVYWIKENSGIDFKIKNVNLLNHNIEINNSKEDYVNVENNSSDLNPYNSLISIETFNTDFLQEINQINSLEATLIQYININKNNALESTNSKEFNEAVKPSFMAINNNLIASNDINIKMEWLHQSILYYSNLFILLKSGDTFEKLLVKRDSLTDFYYKDRIFNNDEIIRFSVAYNQIISIRQRILYDISKKNQHAQIVLNNVRIIKSLYDEEKDKDNNNFLTIYSTQLELIEQTSIALQDQLKRISSILSSDRVDNFANEIQKLYMSFEKGNFEVNIKEYDLENVDLVKLKVFIEPKTSALGYKARKVNFTTNIRTYGGLRFDVSAGLMFNFNLNDRSYFYDSTEYVSDTVRITQITDRNSYLPFIGTQLNIYINKPLKSPISPGINLGVSTNLTDIRYYLGMCLVVGNKDRIVLSGGIVTGQVDVLSGQFETKRLYLKSDLPEIPEVVKAFKTGSYFSITYNLSSNKAKSFGESITAR